jgi:hypothetical protein
LGFVLLLLVLLLVLLVVVGGGGGPHGQYAGLALLLLSFLFSPYLQSNPL